MKLGRKENATRLNLQIALWFGVCVVLLAFLSLTFRFIFVALESKFDGKHRFTVDVFDVKTGEHNVISLEPLSSSASILQIAKGVRGLAIDGHINTKADSKKFFAGKEVTGLNIASVFLDSFIHSKSVVSDLTTIDLLRLIVSSYSLSTSNIKAVSLVLPIADYETDKLLSSFFLDKTISQENVSIQIINGTEIPGFGNRLARVIVNSGGTVVSITTSALPVKNSRINYVGKKTYTAKRLSRLLGFPLLSLDTQLITPTPIQDVLILTPTIFPERRQKALSDIIIVIGEESASSSAF